MTAPGQLSIARFFFRAVICFLTITVLWWLLVAPYAIWPAGWLTQVVMESVFSGWVSDTHLGLNVLSVDTRLSVPAHLLQGLTPQQLAQGIPEVYVELDPLSRFARGQPLLLALLLAGSRKKLARNMAIGLLALIPFQCFSMVFEILKDVIMDADAATFAQMRIGKWHLEVIAFCYQLGTLLLPTIAPIILWLAMDKQFAGLLFLPAGATGSAPSAQQPSGTGATPPAMPAPPAVPAAPVATVTAPAAPVLSHSTSISAPAAEKKDNAPKPPPGA